LEEERRAQEMARKKKDDEDAARQLAERLERERRQEQQQQQAEMERRRTDDKRRHDAAADMLARQVCRCTLAHSATLLYSHGNGEVGLLVVLTRGTLVKGGSVSEWLACWTQAQEGLGSNHSRDAVG